MTIKDTILKDLTCAIVETYASEYGYVKMDKQPALNSFANVAPLWGEGPSGDWHGTLHNPVFKEDNTPDLDIAATNIHVTNAWVLSILEARFGKCYRVIDSDIHFFLKDADVTFERLIRWRDRLPKASATAPEKATIVGYPYGVRTGNPLVSSFGDRSVEHIQGRPDCLWYNNFLEPNAGGKSGSPVFENMEEGTPPFGITTARGSTWNAEAGRMNHWGIVQRYTQRMLFSAAV